MAFEPGNKLASKAGQWRAALNRAIAQEDGKRLRAAAEALLSLAAEGEEWAVKELGDRLDGKPTQGINLGSDPDQPLLTNMTVELVRANPDPGKP